MRTGNRIPPVAEGFHATVYPLKGDQILPSSHHGNRVFDISSQHDTYFTPIPHKDNPKFNDADPVQSHHGRYTGNGLGGVSGEPESRGEAEDTAWKWGEMIRGSAPGPLPKRLRVHVTEPAKEQYLDGNGRFYGARVSPTQRVKDTLWAPPPPTENSWVEQTLPHINWGQFGGSNWTTHRLDGIFHHVSPDRGGSTSNVREGLDGPVEFNFPKPQIEGQGKLL